LAKDTDGLTMPVVPTSNSLGPGHLGAPERVGWGFGEGQPRGLSRRKHEDQKTGSALEEARDTL